MFERRQLKTATIKELGLKFRPFPNRRVKARAAALDNGGSINVLNSNNTIYCDMPSSGYGNFGELQYSEYALRKAHVALLLRIINETQFEPYAAKCRAAISWDRRQRLTDQLEVAADELGIKWTFEQRRLLREARR